MELVITVNAVLLFCNYLFNAIVFMDSLQEWIRSLAGIKGYETWLFNYIKVAGDRKWPG